MVMYDIILLLTSLIANTGILVWFMFALWQTQRSSIIGSRWTDTVAISLFTASFKLHRVEFQVEFQVTRISIRRNFLWQNLPADLQYYISWYANSTKCRPDPNPNSNPNSESFHRVESRVTRNSETRLETRLDDCVSSFTTVTMTMYSHESHGYSVFPPRSRMQLRREINNWISFFHTKFTPSEWLADINEKDRRLAEVTELLSFSGVTGLHQNSGRTVERHPLHSVHGQYHGAMALFVKEIALNKFNNQQ